MGRRTSPVVGISDGSPFGRSNDSSHPTGTTLRDEVMRCIETEGKVNGNYTCVELFILEGTVWRDRGRKEEVAARFRFGITSPVLEIGLPFTSFLFISSSCWMI